MLLLCLGAQFGKPRHYGGVVDEALKNRKMSAGIQICGCNNYVEGLLAATPPQPQSCTDAHYTSCFSLDLASVIAGSGLIVATCRGYTQRQ